MIRSRKSPAAALAPLSLQDDRLLGTAEAARLLGCSQKTLRQLRCDRKGPPCLKMGGTTQQARVFYRRSALEQWVTANAVPLCG